MEPYSYIIAGAIHSGLVLALSLGVGIATAVAVFLVLFPRDEKSPPEIGEPDDE
jgi:hypothetical protein